MPFKDKIVEIMGKALDVSENTNIDVFVEYSPHCSLFELRTFNNGWSSSVYPDVTDRVYLDSSDDVDAKLDDILDRLNTMSHTIGVCSDNIGL